MQHRQLGAGAVGEAEFDVDGVRPGSQPDGAHQRAVRDAGGDGQPDGSVRAGQHLPAPRHRPDLAVVGERLPGELLRHVVGEQLVPAAEEVVVVAGAEVHRSRCQPRVVPEQLPARGQVGDLPDASTEAGQQHHPQPVVGEGDGLEPAVGPAGDDLCVAIGGGHRRPPDCDGTPTVARRSGLRESLTKSFKLT